MNAFPANEYTAGKGILRERILIMADGAGEFVLWLLWEFFVELVLHVLIEGVGELLSNVAGYSPGRQSTMARVLGITVWCVALALVIWFGFF